MHAAQLVADHVLPERVERDRAVRHPVEPAVEATGHAGGYGIEVVDARVHPHVGGIAVRAGQRDKPERVASGDAQWPDRDDAAAVGRHRVADCGVVAGAQPQQRYGHRPGAAAVLGDEAGRGEAAGVADGERHRGRLAAGHPVRVGDPLDGQPGAPRRVRERVAGRDRRRAAQQRQLRVAEPEAGGEQHGRAGEQPGAAGVRRIGYP
ncbi:hypothetical protein Pflav_047990 [Phytohabitans flavus]|uniref:Uncharacterized protein n=1 Tax=Phytohabitans flavus TaxID=1076124 RepID=A0A6F8XX63_9ACTN|nr:hypothetical protein Pflav_047990 [Phytohabitans flavus]